MRESSFPPPLPLRQLAEITDFNLYVTMTFDPLLEQAINQVRFGGAANTEAATTHPGTPFAVKYVVTPWGGGSQCVMMAIVAAATGKIREPPLSGAGTDLYVPLDNLSKMKTEYRIDSSLMVLRNACRDFKDRQTCGTYYFNWKDNRFVLVKFVMVDPLKDLP